MHRIIILRSLAPASLILAAIACAPADTGPTMDTIAERYVRLILQIGQHDADYVDAYYGDESWRPTGTPVPLTDLAAEAGELRRLLPPDGTGDDMARLRRAYLDRQLASSQTRLQMLQGTDFSFDDEAERLYDATPPHQSQEVFQGILDELGTLLPGPGLLLERYEAFRNRFVIPSDRLDAVFRAAVEGCRSRTAEHLQLPTGESFTIEYVTDKSWSGYNWYQGNFTSLIQVNTDLPITIDRAIDLACHEGYPGHHVYNVMLEQALVRGRGWIEFSVYPLFSPQSLIAEGTANFGIDVAFPGEARTSFERDVLYPLAGLDPSTADRYARVRDAVDALGYAGNEVARRYLDGEISTADAADELSRWNLMPRDRAAQRVRFFDQYRSYVINYNLGQDLVREFIEGRGGTADQPDVRWREFGALLASPRLPSGLR